MTMRRAVLAGAILGSVVTSLPASAQTYEPVPPAQVLDRSRAERANRLRVEANRRRILTEEANRKTSTRRTDPGVPSTSADALIRNGGLPTSGQGRRSVPVVGSNNRTQLVPQR